ncbi:uncharacterized protein EAF01_008973 [Botrytis porri]|uniref:uncharacterized protein n=1 Tax=Botrytis porri TaxID=87229 RepID=UPI0018FF98CA|nr:uncharacterized protein EAF01_008973 [Botrytis porri]KAF7898007.1 hypothetical protein EAF01_008973 [Botrytis porri]
MAEIGLEYSLITDILLRIAHASIRRRLLSLWLSGREATTMDLHRVLIFNRTENLAANIWKRNPRLIDKDMVLGTAMEWRI